MTIQRHILATARLGTLLALFAGCASSEPNAPVLDVGRIVAADAGAEIVLAPGEIANVASANLHVRFSRVLGDSRCPTKALVQCVWAGSVVIEVEAGPMTGPQFSETRRLETVAGRDTATVGGALIRLLRASPERETTDALPVDRYRVTVVVGTPK